MSMVGNLDFSLKTIVLETVSLYQGNEFAILRVFESQKSPFTTKIAM